MRRWWKLWRVRILLFLSVVGPGFITANVDNDAGGIFTYSQAGARFGFSLLWTFIPVVIALVVAQEMCARMGAITGKGLSDLIREEFGLRITFLMMMAILVTNFGNIVAEFAGVASSMELFGVKKYISVPIAAVLVWVLIVYGNYKTVEKIFLGASMFYVAYFAAGVLARPRWMEALASTVTAPALAQFKDTDYMYLVVGIVGATIAPWMQFYIQAAIVEKGVTEREYRLSRMDVFVGGIFAALVASFIIIACGATLFVAGKRDIHEAVDAAYALKPLAGQYASILFALGLLNASVFAASILPLSTAYTVCEGLGFESGVGKKFHEAPTFYWLYTVLIVLGAGLVLLPKVNLVQITILSQVINGTVLPLVLVFMLLLINKRDVMGRHVNSRFFNIVAWSTAIIVMVLTAIMLYQQWHEIVNTVRSTSTPL